MTNNDDKKKNIFTAIADKTKTQPPNESDVKSNPNQQYGYMIKLTKKFYTKPTRTSKEYLDQINKPTSRLESIKTKKRKQSNSVPIAEENIFNELQKKQIGD